MQNFAGPSIEFRLIAVTSEQIERYGLSSAPPKPKDKRGNWNQQTVQAEALSPQQPEAEVEAAILTEIDQGIRAETLASEQAERDELRRLVGDITRVEEE